ALTKEVAALGVDAIMVVTPAYNKPTPAGLKAHYAAVCDAAGDTPVILYNVPGRTACNMQAPTVAAIAEANPNVAAIKDASGSIWQMTENRRLAPSVTLLCGDDGLTLPALSIGAKGVVSVVSNLAPKLCSDLIKAWDANERAEAQRLHVALQPLIDACFMESSPTPVKYGLSLLGIGDGSLRLPLAEAESATRERVAHLMSELGLLN
ncbi:MAG: 4-hydroxy-tetrahydrodipicolinate synthase, partial [Planctomycetes bacterium]|nr:4-hydroxy-tetrahydrodipicolinate synthase [Planctomycetota bacterium]